MLRDDQHKDRIFFLEAVGRLSGQIIFVPPRDSSDARRRPSDSLLSAFTTSSLHLPPRDSSLDMLCSRNENFNPRILPRESSVLPVIFPTSDLSSYARLKLFLSDSLFLTSLVTLPTRSFSLSLSRDPPIHLVLGHEINTVRHSRPFLPFKPFPRRVSLSTLSFLLSLLLSPRVPPLPHPCPSGFDSRHFILSLSAPLPLLARPSRPPPGNCIPRRGR